MSKPSLLRSAIGAIESSKPIVLPKQQTFTRPAFQNPDAKETDPWEDSRPNDSKPQSEKEHKNKPLTQSVPDNRGPENQDADNQVTDNQDSDFNPTQNQDAENQKPVNQVPDNQHPQKDPPDIQQPENPDPENQEPQTKTEPPTGSDSLVFGRGGRKSTHQDRTEQKRKPKAKSISLKRKSATKDQIAPFINPRASKGQRFMQLAEEDTLDLLRAANPDQALKGNDWPIFLFMSLKAYEWDADKHKRREGKRNFATEYVARGTGVSESTAFEVMNRLIAKGYVKPIEANARGNVYQVSPLLFYRPQPEGTKKTKDNPHSETQSDRPNPVSKSETSVHPKSDRVTGLSGKHSPENHSPSTPKISEPVHLKSGTRVDLVDFIDLSLLEKHFEEIYFSKIRAPQGVEDEKRAFRSIVKRNRDLTQEEFLECFEVVSKQKDHEGKSIAKRFVWMAGGFDTILKSARANLRAKLRKAESSDETDRALEDRFHQSAHNAPENDPKTTNYRREANRQERSKLQIQIDKLSDEISRHENLYTLNLEEGDLSRAKALKKQREELYKNNAEILDFNATAFWSEEIDRITALMESVTFLHAKVPRSVALGHQQLGAIKIELQTKIKNLTEETNLIKKSIAESLGMTQKRPLQLATG